MKGTMSQRDFRGASFCMPLVALVALWAVTVANPAPGWAAANIWIKTGSPWSVTGGDDLQRLKGIASAADFEFGPTAETTAALKLVGVKTIRVINADVVGSFDKDGKFIVEKGAPYLDGQLDLCRSLGAIPHVIIGGLSPDLADLSVKEQDVADPALKKLVHDGAVFGPTDWPKYRSYTEAFIEYVMVTKGFANAEFEVGNEPDIGGGLYPFPPKPAMGSRAAYEAAFNLYKNCAEAAESFEQKHPGLPVRIGGPALAWAFTYKWGDFNWTPHFLRDCSEEHVKLDFLGLHFYGNNSSLDGEYSGYVPSFAGMMRVVNDAIAQYYPQGLPVYFMEWGPSYQVGGNDPKLGCTVNADNIGAAWASASLNTMLTCGVTKASSLTTDLWMTNGGKLTDEWSWDALFLAPPANGGKAYPKPLFHVFEMVSRLEGHRVEATRGNQTVNCFVSADPEQRKITMLVWNYVAVLNEASPPVEKAVSEPTQVHVRDAGNFFHSPQVKVEAWQINGDTDNIPKMLMAGVAPDETNTAMAQLPATTATINQGALEFSMTLPPSSVSLVVLTENP
jgi:hypothetical protein